MHDFPGPEEFKGFSDRHYTGSRRCGRFALAFSSMAGSFGNNFWQTVGLVITFIIMVLGISGGIEKINKIIMPLFFLLFLGLLSIHGAFRASAADGYRYIFRIDLKGLADPMTWYSPGTGVLLTVTGRKRHLNLRLLSG